MTSQSGSLTKDAVDELEGKFFLICLSHHDCYSIQVRAQHITIANHTTPFCGSRMQVPAHLGRPATPRSPYHLSAPSTPQFPLTPQTIPTRHIPTPQQATSRLEVDQTRTVGPPFFVVFKGREPGIFTDWYVFSPLIVLIVFFINIQALRFENLQMGAW